METDTTDKHETHRNEALIACLQRCSPVQLNFFDKTRETFGTSFALQFWVQQVDLIMTHILSAFLKELEGASLRYSWLRSSLLLECVRKMMMNGYLELWNFSKHHHAHSISFSKPLFCSECCLDSKLHTFWLDYYYYWCGKYALVYNATMFGKRKPSSSCH